MHALIEKESVTWCCMNWSKVDFSKLTVVTPIIQQFGNYICLLLHFLCLKVAKQLFTQNLTVTVIKYRWICLCGASDLMLYDTCINVNLAARKSCQSCTVIENESSHFNQPELRIQCCIYELYIWPYCTNLSCFFRCPWSFSLVPWRWRGVFNGDVQWWKPQQCKTGEGHGESVFWTSSALPQIGFQWLCLGSLFRKLATTDKGAVAPKGQAFQRAFCWISEFFWAADVGGGIWRALMKMHISTGCGENGQCHRNMLECERTQARRRRRRSLYCFSSDSLNCVHTDCPVQVHVDNVSVHTLYCVF